MSSLPFVSAWEKLLAIMAQCRDSRRLILVIVAIGLLLDNMLLTSVVPIIPAFLYELHHKHDMAILNETYATSTPTPVQLWNRRIEETEKAQLLARLATLSRVRPLLPPKCEKQIEEEISNSMLLSTTPIPQVTTRVTTEPPTDEELLRHEELIQENTEVGVMFASKPIVQALTNPFIGPLTNKIGYSYPLFFGLILLFVSTMIFSIGTTYPILFFARSLQGVGSAFTSVAGMGMLAEKYPDDRERGNSMAIALGGLALGVLIGPPFGGVMYEFVGKSSPFVVLAFFALADGCLQLLVLKPKIEREEQEGASLGTLIRDPYIVVAASAITVANLGIAILEPALPLYMMDKMDSSNWEQGAAFLPASISYLVGTNIFGPLGHRMGRWLAAMCGIIIIGFSLLLIPFATSLPELILPNAAIGFAIGMVDSSIMPMLGYLVDIRHTSVYGSVYAIGDLAFCLGFALGPAFSSTFVRWFGFGGLCVMTAFVCFCFAPVMLILRSPPGKNEGVAEKIHLKEQSVKYTSYTDEELPSNDFDSPSHLAVERENVKPLDLVP